MHLERALVVVNRRSNPDGSYPDFDIRQMEEPLRFSGMADNIDVLYNSDYTPNCDEFLINYCRENKPQIILLCLQGVARDETGGPTVEAAWKITHQLNIPIVVFWFDTHSDEYAELLEKYSGAVTLNLIGGSDSSSHKPIACSNYVYSSLAFDESYFNLPEKERDIDIGFLGSIKGNREQWIEGLRKYGLPVYVSGGQLTSNWMTFEEYCQLTSRFKIALNFASLSNQPIALGSNHRKIDNSLWLLSLLITQCKTWSVALIKNPAKLKNTSFALRVTSSAISDTIRKTRYQIRSRVWEAMWLRACVFEEDNPVTSQYFEPYVDYVPFTTLKDLADKARYYLKNDKERDRIRMNGRAAVEKYYNARVYWENIFEITGIIPGKKDRHHTGEIWNKAYFEKWLLNA
jgi:spore maturation protein CgeB